MSCFYTVCFRECVERIIATITLTMFLISVNCWYRGILLKAKSNMVFWPGLWKAYNYNIAPSPSANTVYFLKYLSSS